MFAKRMPGPIVAWFWCLLACRLTAASRLREESEAASRVKAPVAAAAVVEPPAQGDGCTFCGICARVAKLFEAPSTPEPFTYRGVTDLSRHVRYRQPTVDKVVYLFDFDHLLPELPAGGEHPAMTRLKELVHFAVLHGYAFILTSARDELVQHGLESFPIYHVPEGITKRQASMAIFCSVFQQRTLNPERMFQTPVKWGVYMGSDEHDFPMSSGDVGQPRGTLGFKYVGVNGPRDVVELDDDVLRLPDESLRNLLQATGLYYVRGERMYPFVTLLKAGEISIIMFDYDNTLCPTGPVMAVFREARHGMRSSLAAGAGFAKQLVERLDSKGLLFLLTAGGGNQRVLSQMYCIATGLAVAWGISSRAHCFRPQKVRRSDSGGANWLNIAPTYLTLPEFAWLADYPVVYSRAFYTAHHQDLSAEVVMANSEHWKPETLQAIQNQFDETGVTVTHWLSIGDQPGDCVKATPGKDSHHKSPTGALVDEATRHAPTIFTSCLLADLQDYSAASASPATMVMLWKREMTQLTTKPEITEFQNATRDTHTVVGTRAKRS